MGLLEFDKLPINTLVGADWKTFKAVTADKTIDKGFRNKYYLTKSVCRLLSLLHFRVTSISATIPPIRRYFQI